MNEDQEIKIGLTCSDDSNDSEIPNISDWDGKGLPPVGVECEVYGALGESSVWNKCKVFAIELGVAFISNGQSWTSRPVSEFKFRKPETPEQREDRERLEAGYELYKTCGIQHETVSFNKWFDNYKDVWLNIVDKTHYRITK